MGFVVLVVLSLGGVGVAGLVVVGVVAGVAAGVVLVVPFVPVVASVPVAGVVVVAGVVAGARVGCGGNGLDNTPAINSCIPASESL